MLAPIVLFVYNRPRHTLQTLEALSKNDLAAQSTLYIYADGPRANADEKTTEQIRTVRNIIKRKKWCKEVVIVEREMNLGLADSIIQGVSEIVNKYGRVIVLEDDIVTSKGFLQYMNDALELYASEERVMHISGYMFPLKAKLPDTFFYNATTCWGWATWKRAWAHLNTDALDLYNQLVKTGSLQRFDGRGERGFLQQLTDNVSGKLKTWAIKWHTSVFLKRGCCLHPGRSLVNNIGHDNSGEHCIESDKFNWSKLARRIDLATLEPTEHPEILQAVIAFNSTRNSYRSPLSPSLNRLVTSLKRLGKLQSSDNEKSGYQ